MNVPNWGQIPLVIVGTTGMVGGYALRCALVGSRFDSFRAHQLLYFQAHLSALNLKLWVEKVSRINR